MTNLTATDKITQAITNFVKGGDNSDTELLDKVLHTDFRVTNNGFMGTSGVTVIDKNQYLANIKAGIFGGIPRKMTIDSIEYSVSIAMVKLRLESSENYFVSYNSLVLDTDNEWKLINNLAVVESRR
jgi:Putative lumazine-binding